MNEQEVHSQDMKYLGDKVDFVHHEIKLLILGIQDDIKEIKRQVVTINGRVSRLEMWRSFLLGGATTVGIGFAFLKVFIK